MAGVADACGDGRRDARPWNNKQAKAERAAVLKQRELADLDLEPEHEYERERRPTVLDIFGSDS